ncbi:hypothetical protein [Dactylosporangium sp. NPDC051484]|uniref:hypothetical protein n=1 Tax=Dactylosporangium sp. NPDC051484 TaxID=3154942 RepID=UPI00344B5FF4
MQTQSLWEHTLTFFPQFLARLKEHAAPNATVAVVGASDGKFVLPLVAAGYRVIAIERDPQALYGGNVHLPGDVSTYAMGLLDRLKLEAFHDRVQIVDQDFLDAEPLGTICEAVWTSCSWHYSANHHRPLADFITRMQHLVLPNGLFGAEFMMPNEPSHHMIENYTTSEDLRRYFASFWNIMLTLQTDEFTERAHIGQPYDHTHRMGLILATRAPE